MRIVQNLCSSLKIRSFGIIAVGLALLIAAARGDPLVYQLSTPVSGFTQLGLTDYGGSNPAQAPGGAVPVSFGTLQETVYFDPSAGTLRQVGFVPLIVSGSIVLNEMRQINGQTVQGTLTLDQSFTNNAGISFDTGALPLTFDSATQAHLTNINNSLSVGTLPPVSGSYSLLTGGRTYTGNFSYSFHGSQPIWPFYDITFSSDQSSITLDHLWSGNGPPGNTRLVVINGGADAPFSSGGQFTAPNGFQMSLSAGVSDNTDYFEWSAGPALATLVPEPGVLSLFFFGLGLMGITVLRRKLA